MNYYKKPEFVKISQIKNKHYSLHPMEHRIVPIPGRNYILLRELCDTEDVGKQIDVSEYLPFDTKYYLQTISCMEGNIVSLQQGKNISPLTYNKSAKKLSKGNFCISRNASIGKIAYVSNDCKAIVNGGISFFKFKDEYKYYIPAFFITNYGEDTLKCTTSGGGTQQNVKRETLLNIKIPLPANNMNHSQEEVITYVSALVQLLIEKEMMIEKKVKKINAIIENEMKKKQSKTPYKFPTIKEIKNRGYRLDTGVYERKYKEVMNQIVSFEKGFHMIRDMEYDWISGKTPDIILPCEKGKYWWIAVGDISYGLKFKELNRYNTAENISGKLEDGDILITRKGATVGKMNMYFDLYNIPAFVNEDIKVLRLKEKMEEKVFIGMFLNSKYGQEQMLNLASRGTKQGLTNENILDICVPDFDDKVKAKIFQEYYQNCENKREPSEPYLRYHIMRNQELGICQLNMEMFMIKRKLEGIVAQIVKQHEIQIDYML